MKLSLLYQMFYDKLKYEDAAKPKTLSGYDYFIKDLFIIRYLHDKDVEDLILDDYKKYLVYLREKGTLKSKSIHTYFNSVRTFGNFLYREHYTDVDIVRDGPKVKVYNTIKEILYDDEIELIFSVLDDSSDQGMIIKLIFAILLDTGIRPSELCSIEIKDINFSNSTILIHGDKVYSDRLVPISIFTKKYISKYLQRRIDPLERKDRDILIISLRTKKRLTVRSIRGLCDRWIKDRAGIQRAHAYLFRHTFATRSLYLGKSIYDVKILLGHNRVSTTEGYLRNVSQLRLAENLHISETKDLLRKLL